MIIKDKIYGDLEINEELAIKLIETKEMQRIKHVNPNSTYQFVSKKFNTSKFEHCVGVYYLLKKFNASYEEQIAGLIHDTSHFAFAHVFDYVLGDAVRQEKHDDSHEEFLSKGNISAILKAHGLDFKHIINEENFHLLGNKLPDISADRLDYFLRDSFTFGLCQLEKIKNYLDSVAVINNNFVIKDKDTALSIAKDFMAMTEQIWATPFQSGSFKILAEAIKKGLEKGFITKEDSYSTDKELLKKLEDSKDREIINLLDIIKGNKITAGTKEDHDVHSVSKARYIDPLFFEDGGIKRLSEADKAFADKIIRFKERINKGFYIKILR
jgi:HD superfamily phosphohydrolase